MSTITNTVQEKLDTHSEEDVEEEEALSLCDLPINHEDQAEKQDSKINEKQEEFNFHSWRGLFSQEPEMCIADEVFFQGQILPLRHSFSSEAGLLTTCKQFNRGKSLDHSNSLSQFRSTSSRSSSLNSSSTSSSSTSSTTPIISKPKFRNRNQFHTYPSPKPQLKLPIPKQTSFGYQCRKSSLWEIFRLGVVPTPEIGLQDLKKVQNKKNCVSRNSSSSSSNNSGKTNNHFLKQFVGKSGGLLSGCDCSIETVMIKGGTKSTNMTESTAAHAVKEKVVELKKKKLKKKEGKKVMSRRRTFEWIKELHANHDDDDVALLSNT